MTMLKIEAGTKYDGEYELDGRAFSTREWRLIRKFSGYMPFTIEDGISGGDPDLMIAFAVIAMQRAGKVGKDEMLDAAEALSDLPFDEKLVEFGGEDEQEEADAVPPELTSEPEEPSPSGSLENKQSEKQTPDSNGSDSPSGSEKSGLTRVPTGTTR